MKFMCGEEFARQSFATQRESANKFKCNIFDARLNRFVAKTVEHRRNMIINSRFLVSYYELQKPKDRQPNGCASLTTLCTSHTRYTHMDFYPSKKNKKKKKKNYIDRLVAGCTKTNKENTLKTTRKIKQHRASNKIVRIRVYAITHLLDCLITAVHFITARFFMKRNNFATQNRSWPHRYCINSSRMCASVPMSEQIHENIFVLIRLLLLLHLHIHLLNFYPAFTLKAARHKTMFSLSMQKPAAASAQTWNWNRSSSISNSKNFKRTNETARNRKKNV